MRQATAASALKQRLHDGPHAVGTFATLPSPGVAEVLALAGFDFLVLDLEHGPISFETAENMLRAAAAVRDLVEIAAVPGVDVVFVGPCDLSQSLGQPGQVNLPEVQAVIHVALDQVIASPAVAGSHALSPSHARLLSQKGVRYVTLSSDYSLLLQRCRDELVDARRPELET